MRCRSYIALQLQCHLFTTFKFRCKLCKLLSYFSNDYSARVSWRFHRVATVLKWEALILFQIPSIWCTLLLLPFLYFPSFDFIWVYIFITSFLMSSALLFSTLTFQPLFHIFLWPALYAPSRPGPWWRRTYTHTYEWASQHSFHFFWPTQARLYLRLMPSL